MTHDAMTPLPGHVLFAATELLDPHGFRGGIAPREFQDHMQATGQAFYVNQRSWKSKVLIPVITHLLLPRITVPHVHTFEPENNPCRIVEIHGRGWPRINMDQARRALSPFRVLLPYDRVENLYHWGTSMTHRGVPADLATLALTGGLTDDETLAAWRDGTLTHDSLTMLHALTA